MQSYLSAIRCDCRLCTLLLAVPETADRVAEFSSFIEARERAANLAAFKSGQTSVLVASDGMARGMDVVSPCTLQVFNALNSQSEFCETPSAMLSFRCRNHVPLISCLVCITSDKRWR